MSKSEASNGFLAMAKEMVQKQGHDDFLSDSAAAVGDYESLKKKVLPIISGEAFAFNVGFDSLNFEGFFYTNANLNIDGRKLLTDEDKFVILSDYGVSLFKQVKPADQLKVVVDQKDLRRAACFFNKAKKGTISSPAFLIEKKFFDYLCKDEQFAKILVADKHINNHKYSIFENVENGKVVVDISEFSLPHLGYRQLDRFDGKIFDLEKSVPGGKEFNTAVSKTRTTDQRVMLIRVFYNWLMNQGLVKSSQACWLIQSGKVFSGLIVGDYTRKKDD